MTFEKLVMEEALDAIIDYRGRTPQKSPIGIPTLSAKSVKNGQIDYSECYYISPEEYKKFMTRGFPQKGDILLTTEAPLGMVAKLDRADVAVAQRLLTLRGKKGVLDNDFLMYYLQSSEGQGLLKAKETGTTVTGIKQAEFRKIVIKVPDFQTQKKIAAILSALDEKIAINRAINENLERQAQAMVSEYAERTLYSSVFSDIMNFDNGFAFQSSTYLPSGKYKIITIKNVQDGYIDSTGSAFIDSLPQRMKDNCILNIGDVLLSLTGNVGRVGIVCEENLLLNQRVAKIVPIDNKLLPFLYFVFRQSGIKTKLETIAKGTAQLNLSPIETLKLTIPYEERSAVQLSQQLEPLYRKIINNNQESYSFALLRDTLLPKLMSGEIDVSAVQL